VSLDFDILIESVISLCIIETVGAIFRENKPWIVLLITQCSKSSKILALSLGLFDLQGLLPFIILECQKFVRKLFAFFSKEKATKKPIVSFDWVYQRTSKALGVFYTSVHRIMNGKRPCKSNRPKERAKILDDFEHCVIKRTIHGLFSRKIVL
jgi:hypothetical protein